MTAPKQRAFVEKEKPAEVRNSNIIAAKAVADAVRTSLGPKGMDKMIQNANGEVVITNDGATILKQMSVLHPAAKMLVELSAAQDVEAGDGTTSVVVLAGSLLTAVERLLEKGLHPTTIADAFQKASYKAVEFLGEMAIPVDLSDRDSLLKSAVTSLNSKIVSQYSNLLAPIAVDSVLKVVDPKSDNNVDLKDIRMVQKLGGTIDDTELVDGIVMTQNVLTSAGGPTSIEKAKIALIQFQLSPPKPDMENQIVVNDYRQMDKILKEERTYLLNIVKKIKKTGCNVILIQKSILRDAISELALHFLAKLKIMAIKDIERDEVEFVCKTLGCKPIADIESFSEDKLGSAELVEELSLSGSKVVKITGVKNPGKTVSILIRGANGLVLEEAERSLHDAHCVIRCLVKKRALIAGGGAPEIEVSLKMQELAKSMKGMEAYCFQAFGEALEIIPTTLAENAGLNPILIVTELRNRHAKGEKAAGINVRKGTITNILEENVVQPLLVSTSAISLATETVRMILDDWVMPQNLDLLDNRKMVAKDSTKGYKWEEVAQHNTPDSLWISIRGKVYDVTDFAQKHPGGYDIIYIAAGRDATQVFETYHDFKVKEVLKKYYIGDLLTNELPTFPDPGPFYTTLKQRVNEYFVKTGQDPKFHPMMIVRYLGIYGMIAVSWYLQFFVYKQNLFLQSILAIFLGWGCALLGLMPMHDSSHFSFTHNPMVWRILGATHDFLNGSSFLNWMYQHILGHHPYTNIAGADPDIVTAEVDVRRIKPSQRWYERYINQQYFVPILYGVLGVKTRLQDPKLLFVEKKNDAIRTSPVTPWHLNVFWAGKAFFVFYRLLVPILFCHISIGRTLFLFAIADAMSSYWLAILFQANHVVTEVEWPLPDAEGKINTDWAEHQIRTSQDYGHKSWFWTVFSGGLNYQVAHHVFPGILQYYYPQIAPIIKQTCKEFNVEYLEKETFSEAFWTHIAHLKDMGDGPSKKKE